MASSLHARFLQPASGLDSMKSVRERPILLQDLLTTRPSSGHG